MAPQSDDDDDDDDAYVYYNWHFVTGVGSGWGLLEINFFKLENMSKVHE